MNKSMVFSLAAVLPVGVSAAITPSDISVTSDITFASEYVFRGIEFANNSFQPSVEVEMGDLYVGIWANLPTEAVDSEINYYAGYLFGIPDMPYVLDVGLTVYHYPDTGSNRTHEAYAGVDLGDFGIEGLGTSVYYFYDFDIESHVLEGTLGYSYPIRDTALSVEGEIALGTVWGGSDVDSYNYYGVSLGLPLQISENATFTPAVHYATAEKYDFGPGERGKNLFWTASVTATF